MSHSPDFTTKRILITGGLGFMGADLAPLCWTGRACQAAGRADAGIRRQPVQDRQHRRDQAAVLGVRRSHLDAKNDCWRSLALTNDTLLADARISPRPRHIRKPLAYFISTPLRVSARCASAQARTGVDGAGCPAGYQPARLSANEPRPGPLCQP